MTVPPPPPPVMGMPPVQSGIRPQNFSMAIPQGQMQYSQGLGISPSHVTHGNQNQVQGQQPWPKQLETKHLKDSKEAVHQVYVIRRGKATPASWRNPPEITQQHVSNSDLETLKKQKVSNQAKRTPVLVQYDALRHDLMRVAVDEVVNGCNANEELQHIFKWDMALLDVKLKAIGNPMFPRKFETTQIRVVVKRELRSGVSPEMAANALHATSNGTRNLGNKAVRNGASGFTNGVPQQNFPYSNGLQGMPGIPPPPQHMSGMHPQQQQTQLQQPPWPMAGQQAHGLHGPPMMNIPPPPLHQLPHQQQRPSILPNNFNLTGQKKNQNQNQNQNLNKGTQKPANADKKVKDYLQDLGRSPVDSDSEDERRHRKGRKSASYSPRTSGDALGRRRNDKHHHQTEPSYRRRSSNGVGHDFDDFSSDYSSEDDSAYTPPSSISDDRHHQKHRHRRDSVYGRSNSRSRRQDGSRYIERERDSRRKSFYEDESSNQVPRHPRGIITRVVGYHHDQRPSVVDDLYDPLNRMSLRPGLGRTQSTRIGTLPPAPSAPRRISEQDRFARDHIDGQREHAAYLAGRRHSHWDAASYEDGFASARGSRRPTIHRDALSERGGSMYASSGRGQAREYRDLRDHLDDELDWSRHEPVRASGDRWL